MNLDRLRKRVRQYIDQVRIIYFSMYVLQANGILRRTKRSEPLDLSRISQMYNQNTRLNHVPRFTATVPKCIVLG